MSIDRFWAIVETTLEFEHDPKEQLTALRGALSKLSIAELEAFESVFDDLMTRSYSWDLWGATYVIHGGTSDDGFEYFRCWLISKGREVFEHAIADPDSLADIVAPDADDYLEFEEFAYVAREVWAEKTGLASDDMPNAANMIYPDRDPSGVKFDRDEAYLSRRYPKLWQRFGNNPLG